MALLQNLVIFLLSIGLAVMVLEARSRFPIGSRAYQIQLRAERLKAQLRQRNTAAVISRPRSVTKGTASSNRRTIFNARTAPRPSSKRHNILVSIRNRKLARRRRPSAARPSLTATTPRVRGSRRRILSELKNRERITTVAPFRRRSRTTSPPRRRVTTSRWRATNAGSSRHRFRGRKRFDTTFPTKRTSTFQVTPTPERRRARKPPTRTHARRFPVTPKPTTLPLTRITNSVLGIGGNARPAPSRPPFGSGFGSGAATITDLGSSPLLPTGFGSRGLAPTRAQSFIQATVAGRSPATRSPFGGNSGFGSGVASRPAQIGHGSFGGNNGLVSANPFAPSAGVFGGNSGLTGGAPPFTGDSGLVPGGGIPNQPVEEFRPPGVFTGDSGLVSSGGAPIPPAPPPVGSFGSVAGGLPDLPEAKPTNNGLPRADNRPPTLALATPPPPDATPGPTFLPPFPKEITVGLNKLDKAFNEAIDNVGVGSPFERTVVDFLDVMIGESGRNLPAQARLLQKFDKHIGLDRLLKVQELLQTGGFFNHFQRFLGQVGAVPRAGT